MELTALRARRVTPVWPVVIVVGAAAVLYVWTHQWGAPVMRLSAVPISFAAFLAVQIAVPRARWNSERAFGPGNVALLLFAMQLVVVPSLFLIAGPAQGALRVMPPAQYINTALLLQALAYVCFSLGYVARSSTRKSPALLGPHGIRTAVAVAFVAVGALGIALAFPTLGELIDYFAGRGDVFLVAGPSTLSDAAASFLQPFLAYGLVVLWASRIVQRRPGQRVTAAELALAAAVLAASGVYSYNRAAVVVPLLALLTAYGRFGRRLPVWRVVVVAALLAALAFEFGQYRAEYIGTQGGRFNATEAGLTGPEEQFTDTVQVYANGAQFWALTVQDADRFGLRDGRTLLGSALLPVPVLGRPFRTESGPTAYNELVYGRADTADQILGFGAELYWNLGLPGLALGYAILGGVVRRFDDLVGDAPDPLAAYTWSYAGVWVALLVINSLSVIAQIAVYFAWPIIAVLLLARLGVSGASEARN